MTHSWRNSPHFLTGDGGAGMICRALFIPDDIAIVAAVNGVLSWLTYEENWRAFGLETPQQSARKCQEMFTRYLEGCAMIGTIQAYVTETTPAHMLPCEGGVYLRVDYPRLYDVIDPIFRLTPDTFQVPDLRGVFLFGAGNPEPLNATGGAREHALTVDEMPAHTHANEPHAHTSNPHSHSYWQPTFGVDIESVGIPDPTGVGNPPLAQFTSAETVTINAQSVTIQDAGGGQAHSNMPPFVAVKYGIVAR